MSHPRKDSDLEMQAPQSSKASLQSSGNASAAAALAQHAQSRVSSVPVGAEPMHTAIGDFLYTIGQLPFVPPNSASVLFYSSYFAVSSI